MNILDILNEQNDLSDIEGEFLFTFERAWTDAVKQIQNFLNNTVPKQETRKKAVNETTIKIGTQTHNINYIYSKRIPFTSSAINIGIMLYLSTKYKRALERWWDEFEKLKSYKVKDRFELVSSYLKTDRDNVDKEKAIDAIQEDNWSMQKAASFFGALFGEVGFTKAVKNALETTGNKSFSSLHKALGSSIESVIATSFDSLDGKVKREPNGPNTFPDFVVIKPAPRGLFASLKKGDYLEAKSSTIKSTEKSIKVIQNIIDSSDNKIDADDLNNNLNSVLIALGVFAPKNLYYFMREGASSNFSLYEFNKATFRKGRFEGSYNTKENSGDLKFVVAGKSFDVKIKNGKMILIDQSQFKKFKNNFLNLVKTVDMVALRKELGEEPEFKGAIKRSEEKKIRRFRNQNESTKDIIKVIKEYSDV